MDTGAYRSITNHALGCLHLPSYSAGHQRVYQYLGVPLAVEKVDGPSESHTFLGIVLDTKNMEVHLPQDELHRTCVSKLGTGG